MPDPEKMEEALRSIEAWANSYPVSIFKEPNFAKAAKLLEAGGMTLDGISASTMRHVLGGILETVRNALKE